MRLSSALGKPPAKQLSVAFVATHPSGGVGELWVNLAEGLAARGFDARCVGLYPAKFGDAPMAGGQPWTHLAQGPLSNPLRALRLVAALARWLSRHRPDLVVTAMPAANVLVPIVARWASPTTRVAISHHSPMETHSALLSRIDSLTGQMSNVNAIVSVSHAVLASLDSKPGGYRSKRIAIRNALPPDIEAFLTETLDSVRREPSRRKLVATGRLAYQKNYPMLLRALKHLGDVSLDIVGTGPDAESLEALARELGVADRVRFMGARPRREALAILAQGDVFVQVSRFEGHSLGLIEAARVGLPLVVSDVPEQIEAITAEDGTRCGIVVPSDDAMALAAALADLLDTPARYADFSIQARRIADEMRFDAVVDAYGALAA